MAEAGYDTRWDEVLDTLEDGIATAITALDNPEAPMHAFLWSPPEGLGPLPEHLRDRAEQIVESQQALNDRMAAERKAAGKHLEAIRSIPERRRQDTSIYLDVNG
jgi:hypothetical protein